MGLVFVLEKVPTQAAPLPEPAVEAGVAEEKDDCMEVDDNIEDDPALEMPEDNQGPESIVPSQSTTTEGKKNDFQGKGKAKQQCISRLYKCITYSTLQEQIKAPKLRRLLWPCQNL